MGPDKAFGMFPEGDGVSEQEVKQRSKEEERREGGRREKSERERKKAIRAAANKNKEQHRTIKLLRTWAQQQRRSRSRLSFFQ